MRVKMLTTADGSMDGVTVSRFDEGWEGEVSEGLGINFIAAGFAIHLDQERKAPVQEEDDEAADYTKDLGGAPENKDTAPPKPKPKAKARSAGRRR